MSSMTFASKSTTSLSSQKQCVSELDDRARRKSFRELFPRFLFLLGSCLIHPSTRRCGQTKKNHTCPELKPLSVKGIAKAVPGEGDQTKSHSDKREAVTTTRSRAASRLDFLCQMMSNALPSYDSNPPLRKRLIFLTARMKLRC